MTLQATQHLTLYVILDVDVLGDRDPLAVTRAVLEGGATALQLRAKQWSVRRQVALAEALLPIAREHRVPLLINDHIEIALAVGADGVHLGVDDLPIALARRIFPQGLIGYSPEGMDDARRAVIAGANYLGVGPFARTTTKPDAGAPIGVVGIQAIVDEVPLPVIAIGGITPATASQALAAGAAGIAVGSAIIADPDPTAATRAFRVLLCDRST